MVHKELVGVAYKESMSNLGSKCPCLVSGLSHLQSQHQRYPHVMVIYEKEQETIFPNCGKEMVLAESHERECDESAIEYNFKCTSCGYQVNVIEPTEEEKKEAFKDFWNNET